MPGVHETAYPRLKASVTTHDLTAVYTPTSSEIALADTLPRTTAAKKLCFLLLLKTFQRLGYFVPLHDVPAQIVNHIRQCLGTECPAVNLAAYDQSGTRRRHVHLIRQHLNVKMYDDAAQKLLATTVRVAAQTKEELVDIINIGIEELIHQRHELPGFTTLLEEAQHGRAEVNRAIYQRVAEALGADGRMLADDLLTADLVTRRTTWNVLKGDPGKPTLTELRHLVDHLHWLSEQNAGTAAFAAIPDVKMRHWALEAKSLDAARMSEMEPNKRYTLAAALIKMQ